MTMRVLIADDHPIVRTGIKNTLKLSPDMELAGEATNGDQVLKLCDALDPDILVLDVNMPGLKAVQILRILKGKGDRPRILILTAFSESEIVSGMLRAGADGFLLKDEEPEMVLEAVHAVASGRTWVSPLAMRVLIDDEPEETGMDEPLSSRELDVLRLIAQGVDNPHIAEKLSIAEGTVKNHVSSIYDKLGVHSRAEAVAWAWKHNIG